MKHYPRGRYYNDETGEEILDLKETMERMERLPCSGCGGKSFSVFLFLPEDTSQIVVEPLIPNCRACVEKASLEYSKMREDVEGLDTIQMFKEKHKAAMMLRFEPGLVYRTTLNLTQLKDLQEMIPISFSNDNPGTFEITEKLHVQWEHRGAFFHIFDNGKILVMSKRTRSTHNFHNVIEKVTWEDWYEMLAILRTDLISGESGTGKWIKEVIFYRFDEHKRDQAKKSEVGFSGLKSLLGDLSKDGISPNLAKALSVLLGVDPELVAKAGTDECECSGCTARRAAEDKSHL